MKAKTAENESVERILARYARVATVEDGYYYDEDDRCWQKIPELEALGYYAKQLEFYSLLP